METIKTVSEFAGQIFMVDSIFEVQPKSNPVSADGKRVQRRRREIR